MVHSCIAEFADLQNSFLMYRSQLNLVTSVNSRMKNGVLRFLQKPCHQRVCLFGLRRRCTPQAAFDPEVQSDVPYNHMLRSPTAILVQSVGSVIILQLRRQDSGSRALRLTFGFNKYWKEQ